MIVKPTLTLVLLACFCTLPPQAGADPVLQLLIEQALEQNPGMQALHARIQGAEAARQEVRASYYPRFGAGASITRTDNAPQAFMMQLNQRRLDMRDPTFNPNNPDDTTNIQMSLGIQYPLYHAGRTPQRDAARLQKNLAHTNLAAARNDLVHTVTQGYYQVLEAQAFSAVQEAAQASFAESLRVARERHATGAAVRTDVLNLEVQMAQANENLIRARNGVQLAIAALHATIGANVLPADGLQEPEASVTPPATVPLATHKRPEHAAARLQYDIAAQQLKIARAGKRPALQAFGSALWDGQDIDEQEQSYIAGVALEWNWFDGGATRARMDAARAMQAAAEAATRQTHLQLELESKQAALQLQEAWERIQVTQQAILSAEEALRITRALYQEGATEIATLLVAEVGLTETRMRATAARYDYRIAQSNTKRVAGLLATPAQQHE